MTFPKMVPKPSLHFVTDDWISGAGLMGFSEAHIRRVLMNNAGRAAVVAAVTEYLAHGLAAQIGREVEVVPNGCRVPAADYAIDPGFAKAALIGQLNERLDFEVLEAVAHTGIHIAVAGPKTAKSPETISRLESFLARPNVHWHGVLDTGGVADLLASSNVGLTPYKDTQFNRSSFPLKTLEYVAAGVPVVATDLPASQFDAAARVHVAGNAADFARAVAEVSTRWPTDAERAAQARQAIGHSWENRAQLVRKLLTCDQLSRPMNTHF
ncbi:glycosyltransferase [Arthrobacter sp. PAMC 25486]|uniref:glycosyltransferase n=1 Tax=Arthrobacter sp. PAMC 25486 TaxID=1494608 RepID=UPI00138E1432|nr:glycosyltransferase [Arthrobacter sp. PAMC 25486]